MAVAQIWGYIEHMAGGDAVGLVEKVDAGTVLWDERYARIYIIFGGYTLESDAYILIEVIVAEAVAEIVRREL